MMLTMNEYLSGFDHLPDYMKQKYKDFLSRCGLKDEGNCDYTVLMLDDEDNIRACGSLRGSVLMQIAVDQTAEGGGFCAQIVTALLEEAFNRGY